MFGPWMLRSFDFNILDGQKLKSFDFRLKFSCLSKNPEVSFLICLALKNSDFWLRFLWFFSGWDDSIWFFCFSKAPMFQLRFSSNWKLRCFDLIVLSFKNSDISVWFLYISKNWNFDFVLFFFERPLIFSFWLFSTPGTRKLRFNGFNFFLKIKSSNVLTLVFLFFKN